MSHCRHHLWLWKFFMLFAFHMSVTAILGGIDIVEVGNTNVAKHIMFSLSGWLKTQPICIIPVIAPLKIFDLLLWYNIYPSSIIGLPFLKFFNVSIFINLIDHATFLIPGQVGTLSKDLFYCQDCRAHLSSTNFGPTSDIFPDLQFSVDFQRKSVERNFTRTSLLTYLISWWYMNCPRSSFTHKLVNQSYISKSPSDHHIVISTTRSIRVKFSGS